VIRFLLEAKLGLEMTIKCDLEEVAATLMKTIQDITATTIATMDTIITATDYW
jgi:hypothetical protein